MRAASDPADRYVQLKGGLAVPVEPLLLLLALEARGITACRDGDALIISPASALTDEECQQIQHWKPHLLSLIDYVPPEVQ